MNPFGLPPELVDTLVANKIVAQLAFLAAVGGLSAALVKALDDLVWIKSTINRNFLKAWFAERLSGNLALLNNREKRIYGLRSSTTPTRGSAGTSPLDKAWSQTLELCAAGQERALTELDVDQICGQLNSAAQIVIQFPDRYRQLLNVLAAGAPSVDVAELVKAAEGSDATRTQSMTRMANYLQRSVDALHILLQSRWEWWQQVAGFVFSAAITFTVMLEKNADHGSYAMFSAHLLLATLVGGFLAPIARSVVTAIQNKGQ
jgi:hypothetical protein